MSDIFKHYLAGQLALLPEFLPFYAPTINSYKRLGMRIFSIKRAHARARNATIPARAFLVGDRQLAAVRAHHIW